MAKGKEWIRNTLSPIVGLKHWNFVDFIAFPNLENKGVLKKNEIIIDNPELLVQLFYRIILLNSCIYLSECHHKRRDKWHQPDMVDWKIEPGPKAHLCFWSVIWHESCICFMHMILLFRWNIWRAPVTYSWFILCLDA